MFWKKGLVSPKQDWNTCADPVIRQTESSTWEMGYKCALVSAWIAPKLLPSLLQAHQPFIREAHQPLGSRPLGQVAGATLTDHNNKTQTCIFWKAIQRAIVYKQTQAAQ